MKKIILTTLFAFAILMVNAQTITYGSNSNEVMNISKGNMYVVLTGDEVFDKALENSVKNYWKQSPYKTISRSELNKNLGNGNNYFISLVVYQADNSASLGGPKIKDRQELVVFNGEKSSLKKYSSITMMVTVPMILDDQKEYWAQTDYLVKSLNDGIEIVKNIGVEGLSTKVMYAVLKEIRKSASILKEKTLLIDKELVINDQVMSKYKYKYKVLPAAEISKLLIEGNKEYCVLSLGIFPFKQIFIQDLETKKVIYGVSTQGAIDLNAKDFVKLNDIIDGKENDK